MVEQEDWLYRPIIMGMMKAESLYDGTMDLEQIALLNEAIDVHQENQSRANAAAKAKR